MSKTYVKVNIILWSTVALVAVICLIGGIFGTKNNDDGNGFGFSSERYDGDMVERKSRTITEDINDISINWVRGRVEIFESENDEIRVVQFAPADMPEKKLMSVTTPGRELVVMSNEEKRHNGWNFFSFGVFNEPKTYLEVYLPKKHYNNLGIDGVSCTIDTGSLDVGELNINTVSGDVTTSGTFDEITMDSVSGKLKGSDITAEKVKLNTVSGSIDVDGSFFDVRVDLVSGNSEIRSSTMLDKFRSNGISGSSTLYIPENDGFTVNFSKVSGRFNSDFDTSRDDEQYTYKDGGADFNVDTVSGSVNVRRN